MIFGPYYVIEKDLLKTASGSPYLKVKLADKDGSIACMVWNDADFVNGQIKQGDIVNVSGEKTEFKGTPQIKGLDFVILDPADHDLKGLLPTVKVPIEHLLEEFQTTISMIQNPTLRSIVRAFLQNETLMEQFCAAPAAKNNHHNYVGGLLEHTLSVMKIVLGLHSAHPSFDREIAIVGAMVHDIGKIFAYEIKPGFSQTKEGSLIGHIDLGCRGLHYLCKDAGIDCKSNDIVLHLDHIILSHHGKKEWGSPVVPMTPEAIAVHFADNADAKLHVACELSNGPVGEDGFSPYSQMLETKIFGCFGKKDHDK